MSVINGGTALKICGSNFQSGAVVEFDGVPATGCTVNTSASPNTIACTGSPAHIAAATSVVRVRNPDTRTGYLPATAYQFSGGTDRVLTSLHLAKATANAALTWTCGSCSAGAPARVYRAQNAQFNLYLEQYSGGVGGAYTNTNAVASAQNYFWAVE